MPCGLNSREPAFLISLDNDLKRVQRTRPQISDSLASTSWGPCPGPISIRSILIQSLFDEDISAEQKFGRQRPLVTKNLSGQEIPSAKGHSTHNSVGMVQLNFFRPVRSTGYIPGWSFSVDALTPSLLIFLSPVGGLVKSVMGSRNTEPNNIYFPMTVSAPPPAVRSFWN